MEDIKKNLDMIRGEIAETAQQCGRSADEDKETGGDQRGDRCRGNGHRRKQGAGNHGQVRCGEACKMAYDRTFADKQGEIHHRQGIHDPFGGLL